MRNPPWTRDELILALDFYFHHDFCRKSGRLKNHPEVRRLSDTLNELAVLVQEPRPDPVRFRNPNGVYMKLCNFLRLDPEYSGKGLQAGGVLEEEVWRDFAGNRERLRETAAAIRARVRQQSVQEATIDPIDEEEVFPEGRILFRAHRARERNRTLVDRAKRLAQRKHGRLACQACGFDFRATYGPTGKGFIECHHVMPVSDLHPRRETKVADLALLCANCHRMVHRRRPWLSMEELGSFLVTRRPG